jgi:uncharacterized protein YigA (DUF484 family)
MCYHSPVPESNDHNLINFIASTVEALRVRIDTISEQMATKVDLANLRDDTKAELAALRDEMASKADLARVESNLVRVESNLVRVESNLARVESQMATKDGLARLETTMHGEFEQVHIRIDSIDRGMGSRIGSIETDVSRMRSVLYLLVKDKPDMLRLLGQPTPGEGRPQG